MQSLDFSAPYNNDPDTLTDIFAIQKQGQNRIREIYLSCPQSYSGSGRIMPEMGMAEFTDIVDNIHNHGIRVNIVINSTCEGSDWYSPAVINSTIDFLDQMHKKHGVESLTIANPLYIKLIREKFPEIEICASVLSEIDCVYKAAIYAKAGANVITPDVNINRDLSLLKKIKENTNVELKLMVNEGCLYKCPFRKFHFNITSHASKAVGKVGIDFSFASFFDFCNQVTSNDHSQILKSCWIRPEDIRKYGEITNYFKIVGRSQPKSRVLRSVKAYMEESWDGDLLDIMCANIGSFSVNNGAYLDNKSLENYGFFEKVTSCNKNCHQCDYCIKIAKELVAVNVFTSEKSQDILCNYNKEIPFTT